MVPLNRYYRTLEQVDNASADAGITSVRLLKELAETDTTLKEFLTRLRFKFATDYVLYYDYYGDESDESFDPSDAQLNAITSFSNNSTSGLKIQMNITDRSLICKLKTYKPYLMETAMLN